MIIWNRTEGPRKYSIYVSQTQMIIYFFSLLFTWGEKKSNKAASFLKQ